MSDWKEINLYGKPAQDGVYIVNSSWGVRAAHFMKDFGNCFQDVMTNQDEGMPDWTQIHNNDFHVTHWMEFPKAPNTEVISVTPIGIGNW